MINTFLSTEPEWLLPEGFSQSGLPEIISNWLSEPGSLTQRIKQSFAGEFTVELLRQGQSKAFSCDAKQLEIGQFQAAFVREVLLRVSGQTLVFARTTIPTHSLGVLDSLTKLGNKPLGEVIFAYPGLERLNLNIAKIPRCYLSALSAQLLGEKDFLWARRNTYKIAGQVFLVSEFFLPLMFAEPLQQQVLY